MPTVLLQEILDLLKGFEGIIDYIKNIEEDIDNIKDNVDSITNIITTMSDVLDNINSLVTSIDDNCDFIPLIDNKVNQINIKLDTVNNNLSTIATNTGSVITPISLIKANTDALLANSNQTKVGVAKIANYIDEIADNTGSLAASLDDIATNTLNIYNKVVTIASDTTDIRTKIGFIKDNTDIMQPDISSILSTNTGMASDVNYIKENLPQGTDLSTVETLLTQIEDEVDGVEGLIGTSNTNTSAIDSKLADIKGYVDDIENSLSNIENNTSPINAISYDTADINNYTNSIANDVTGIKIDTTSIANDISDIKTQLGTDSNTAMHYLAYLENIDDNIGDIEDYQHDIYEILNKYHSFEKLQSQYQLYPSKIYTAVYGSSAFALSKDYQTGAGSGGNISAGQVMTLILGKCNTHGSTSRNDWTIDPIKLEGTMYSNSTSNKISAKTTDIDIASDLPFNTYYARQTVLNTFDISYNISPLQQSFTNQRILDVYRIFNFATNNTPEPLSFWIAIVFATNASTNTNAFDYHNIPNSAAEIKDTCNATTIFTDNDNGKYNILNYPT